MPRWFGIRTGIKGTRKPAWKLFPYSCDRRIPQPLSQPCKPAKRLRGRPTIRIGKNNIFKEGIVLKFVLLRYLEHKLPPVSLSYPLRLGRRNFGGSLARHFLKTFSGWLTFCSRKKNIFEEKIVLEFKRLGALIRNPEIGKIPEQTFQVLEWDRPGEGAVIDPNFLYNFPWRVGRLPVPSWRGKSPLAPL